MHRNQNAINFWTLAGPRDCLLTCSLLGMGYRVLDVASLGGFSGTLVTMVTSDLV